MIQFYFLSVILNLLCGYALALRQPGPTESPIAQGARLILSDRGLRLSLAVLSVAIGALKLLFALRGDIPIIGDFLPAIAGIVVGAALLMELSDDAHLPFMKAGTIGAGIEKVLVSYKVAIGYAGIIAGIIHFLFPMVLFL
ncbi:MAG TPA: hypothetical protein VN445_03590 [Rectinemataceae bacterium]|nr:hypothetical protein [Rectinemataceae bacterium]